MRNYLLINVIIMFLMMLGEGYASYHLKSTPCKSQTGRVLNVVDNEVFTISVCSAVKEFREFSYCYEVEEGDTVMFDGFPEECEMISFTVVRNGVQCGVLCP